MAIPDVVIFGTGRMAQVAMFYIESFKTHNIVGFTEDAAFCRAETFAGRPLVAWETLEQYFTPQTVQLFGPMTYQRLNEIRRDRYLEGLRRGYTFSSFVHPHSHINAEHIGENCLILEANTIQPFSHIGNNVIIWSGSHIGHHAHIEDHCFISSQVGIAGSTVIGPQCHISGQSGVIHDLTIGARCCVLNGALVTKSLPDDTVVVGRSGEVQSYPSSKLRRLL